MSELKVTVGCSFGSARAYADWKAFGAEYETLQAGDERTYPLVKDVLEEDINIMMALPPGQAVVAEILKMFKDGWQSIGVGSNSSGPFDQEEGEVWLKNTSNVPIEVTIYLDHDVWSEDEQVESINHLVAPGDTITAPITQSNAVTVWCRKISG